MTGIERILTALNIEELDRVPLYIHGINEAPIIGIGKHLTELHGNSPRTEHWYSTILHLPPMHL